MRELLGGKGSGMAEMTRVLGAERVPAGFTITTEACVQYMRNDRTEPDGMADQVAEAITRLEEHSGQRPAGHRAPPPPPAPSRGPRGLPPGRRGGAGARRGRPPPARGEPRGDAPGRRGAAGPPGGPRGARDALARVL